MCTSRAWRNTLAAAYPDEPVRWRSIYAAYLSGVGVNAIIPARAGDAVRLFLAHRAFPAAPTRRSPRRSSCSRSSTPPLALLIFAYALTHGVLPASARSASLPGFDFGFFADNPSSRAILLVVARDLRRRSASSGRACTSTSSRRASARGSPCCDDRDARTSARSPPGRRATGLLRFVAIWFFLGAFGIQQSLRNVLLVQVTPSLATLVPISPGGIGTEQAFIVYVFSGTGSDARRCSPSASG